MNNCRRCRATSTRFGIVFEIAAFRGRRGVVATPRRLWVNGLVELRCLFNNPTRGVNNQHRRQAMKCGMRLILYDLLHDPETRLVCSAAGADGDDVDVCHLVFCHKNRDNGTATVTASSRRLQRSRTPRPQSFYSSCQEELQLPCSRGRARTITMGSADSAAFRASCQPNVWC